MTSLTSPIQYDEFDGTPRVICSDCRRWEYEGDGQIRHSSRCNFPKAQYQQPRQTERVTGNVHPKMRANGKTSDELLEGVQKGYLSQSDAMNTDF